MVPYSRLAATILASATITCSCRPSTAPIDPASASCITPGTILLAGLDLDRIRASPLYAKLPPGAALAIEPLRNASRLMVTWDGRQLVFVARGKFREPPAGATLIDRDLAISGSAEAVRGAIAQHKTGTAGAPDLLAHAASIAGGAEIWAVVRGGINLPLTGNAANLNRLLHLVDYATLTARLAPLLDLDLTSASRTADQGQHLEETLRAIVSLAGAASPRLDTLLHSVQIRREGPIVHATLSTDADTLGPVIDGLTR
jgi:hypothetical protein